MTTDTEQVSPSHRANLPEAAVRTGYFLWHYIEMCLVMCIGGISLNVLFFWILARLGYTGLDVRFPAFTLLLVGFLLAVPMTAWMRFRGHAWRPTLEMASTSVILVILLIGAARLGAIPESAQLPLLKKLACPVMLIPMLFRLDLYTMHHGKHDQHAHAEHAAHPAGEHSAHAG